MCSSIRRQTIIFFIKILKDRLSQKQCKKRKKKKEENYNSCRGKPLQLMFKLINKGIKHLRIVKYISIFHMILDVPKQKHN